MDIDIELDPPKKATKKKAAKKGKAKPAKKPAKKAATKKAIKAKAPAKKAAKKKEAKPKGEGKARRSPYKLAGARDRVQLDTALIAEVGKFAKARKIEEGEAMDLLVSVGLSRLAALSRYAKANAAAKE